MAAAKHLSALGATVVLGERRADRIEKLANEITSNGGKALAVPADVTKLDQVKRLVDSAVEQFGRSCPAFYCIFCEGFTVVLT